jgi:hypothetical protein
MCGSKNLAKVPSSSLLGQVTVVRFISVEALDADEIEKCQGAYLDRLVFQESGIILAKSYTKYI